jgi:hypothetical protein
VKNLFARARCLAVPGVGRSGLEFVIVMPVSSSLGRGIFKDR